MGEKQTSVIIRAGRAHELATLSRHPVVAIDLGFSKSAASCGFATCDGQGKLDSGTTKYGPCIDKVCEFVKKSTSTVLILEAPLSGMFDDKGNPVERGDFERATAGQTSAGTRYWYAGAGATICLGAIFFLRSLLAKLEADSSVGSKEILLYEGFVTFKTESSRHDEDASRLLSCFLSMPPRPLFEPSPEPDQTLTTILDVVRGQTSGDQATAPAILIP